MNISKLFNKTILLARRIDVMNVLVSTAAAMVWAVIISFIVLNYANGSTKYLYDGEPGSFGVQILDASLQPDNARTDADPNLKKSIIGQRKDGQPADKLGWTTTLTKVPGDTEGNYYVALTVPQGACDAYRSVAIALRLEDTGWGIVREWELLSGSLMPLAAYTPPPSATVIAGKTDEVLSEKHGSGFWGLIVHGSNETKVKCQSIDPTPLPIASAHVQCRHQESGALLYYALTNANGLATMMLDPGTYDFYAYKPGQYTFDNPQAGTIDEDPEEDIVLAGTMFAPTFPVAPFTCNVYGVAYDAFGNPQPLAVVKVTFSSSYGTYGSNLIVKNVWTGTADEGALWVVPCVPNGLIYPTGTSYKFEVGAYSYSGVVVPNVDSIPLDQIINPPTATPTPTRTPTPTITPTP